MIWYGWTHPAPFLSDCPPLRRTSGLAAHCRCLSNAWWPPQACRRGGRGGMLQTSFPSPPPPLPRGEPKRTHVRARCYTATTAAVRHFVRHSRTGSHHLQLDGHEVNPQTPGQTRRQRTVPLSRTDVHRGRPAHEGVPHKCVPCVTWRQR